MGHKQPPALQQKIREALRFASSRAQSAVIGVLGIATAEGYALIPSVTKIRR
jgi:hypothetical protein